MGLEIKKGYGGNSSSCYEDTVAYNNAHADAAARVSGTWVDTADGVTYAAPSQGGSQFTAQVWEGHDKGLTSGKLTLLKGNFRAYVEGATVSVAPLPAADIAFGIPLTVSAIGVMEAAASGDVVVAYCTKAFDTSDDLKFYYESVAVGSRLTVA